MRRSAGFLGLGVGAWSAAALIPLAAPLAARAQSGETGSVCVHQFAAGVSCIGDDVLPLALSAPQGVEPCVPGDMAEVILDVELSALGAPTSYDVGFYLALNGDSAESGGSCFHDYLEPPLDPNPVYGDANGNTVPDLRNGPWANAEPFVPGDDCGDIPGGTEVIASLATESIPLEISCVDTDESGWVDVSVCASWRSGTQGVCSNLSGATADAGARCSCARLDVVGLPEPGAGPPLALGGALIGLLRGRRVSRGCGR